MPMCVICDSKFYYATQIDPPESCDCGEELDALAAQDETPAAIDEKRSKWHKAIEDAMKPGPEMSVEEIDYEGED